ncbi:hypothetical protein PHYPSEUDO_005146 [Phytophthora pseudosyringae]|uniref:Uncharacterized protein n=1 Tax=Phytophthora pseudosyringae TaxID=221518 RepID=A0A8T1VM21_9STRA|nr:hypothetical protein PHYPSEUDO_005146 [Phytophthora pseudosyringae]
MQKPMEVRGAVYEEATVENEFEEILALMPLDSEAHFVPKFQSGHNVLHWFPWDRLTSTKATPQNTYVGMDTGLVYRRFLNALAQELGKMYVFDCKNGIPIIEDVLHALENGQWEFRLEHGENFTTIPLSRLFDEAELALIKFLKTCSANYKEISNGRIPKTRSGQLFIILPHYLYTLDRVKKLKRIAVKGKIVSVPTEFEVKDRRTYCFTTPPPTPVRDNQSAASFMDVSQLYAAMHSSPSTRQERRNEVLGFMTTL